MSYSFLIFNALLFFFSLPLLHFFTTTASIDNSTEIYEIERLRSPFLATYPDFCYHSFAYGLVYLSQLLATSACALIILAIDTIIATALFHTCGHFLIIEENISKLNFEETGKYLEWRVRKIVMHHQLVIR